MRNKVALASTVASMVRNARFEVLPTATLEDKILASIPTDRALTVTASPAKGIESTVSMAETLAHHGYSTVPHLAARMISGRSELAEIKARLIAADIDTVFVPGGDQDPPAGDFTCALDLLQALSTLDGPPLRVGITGYPETHPSISDDLTVQAMWDKRSHATHIVSNLTFDASLIKGWAARMRSRGVGLPILIGVPGPVERAKLLSMATKIGVGDSTRFLAKHKGTFARLAAPGGFTGERFIEQLAPIMADSTMGVEGLHVYTFNQVSETETWRSEYLARLEAA